MSSGPDGYLTVAEAARLVGTSPKTLRRWIRHGRLPMAVRPASGEGLRREDVMRLVLRPDAEGSNGSGG